MLLPFIRAAPDLAGSDAAPARPAPPPSLSSMLNVTFKYT
jgi:hypothetical protein